MVKQQQQLGLEKTHYNDAFCIENTNGGIKRCNPFFFKQKRVTNRSCQVNRKGYKPSIRRTTYKIQPKDSVWVKGKEYFVAGMMSLGKRILLSNKKTISASKIEKHFSVGSLYV